MNTYYYLIANVVAIGLLVFAIYLPRHRRYEMALSYLVVNIGVMAVASVLATSTAAAGLGLGLFGVLSIIRLRSEELTQREVAYYFAALALGLLGGLGATVTGYLPIVFMGAILGLIGLIDSRLFNANESRLIILDRALVTETEISAHVASLFGQEVTHLSIVRIDMVNDSTIVRAKLGAPITKNLVNG